MKKGLALFLTMVLAFGLMTGFTVQSTKKSAKLSLKELEI